MSLINQTVREIKELKIQGATNIARASLKALATEPENLQEGIAKLSYARPNEPLTRNCLAFVLKNLLQQKDKLPEQVVKESVALLLDRLNDIDQQIIKNGLPLIKSGTNIFTHCHSSTVVNVLKAAHEQGMNCQVFLTETRPKMQGRLTAKELTQEGIKTTLMADSAAGFTLSTLDQIDINLVLLGADVIALDGSVVNKIGSFSIAFIAKKAKIPLYIVASLLKLDRTARSASAIPLEKRSALELWPQRRPRKLKILNLAFDPIPKELITALVTEFGKIKPKKVKAITKKNYPWIAASPKVLIKKQKKQITFNNQQSAIKYSYFYLKKKVNPQKHIIATYKILPSKKEVIEAVAAESSIGTWTKIIGQTEKSFKQLSAKIIKWQKKSGSVKIAYPLLLFEKGNLPQLLSSVAGNIFGMEAIKRLHLLDLNLPEKYVESFPGPKFGIKGIRRLTGVKKGPLLGSIIKPKLGLKPRDYAELAKTIFQAGFHLVKDDENLTSQTFNRFERRVKRVNWLLRKNELLKNKLYAFNVTSEAEMMKRRARFVQDAGGRCVMVDLLTVGFSGLQYLRKQNLSLVIHGHRAMHGVLTRSHDFSLSMMVIAKLARLAGVDSLHTGTVVGKMEGEREEIIPVNEFLKSDWYGLKKVLPVASGGLHPRLIPQLIEILGDDLLINFGGGVHGHPRGVASGAQAVVEALEAIKKGISLKKYAQDHENLRIALEKWR